MSEEFAEWARANLRVYRESSPEWSIFCFSPDHENWNTPAACLNVETGLFICYSCGFSGSLGNNAEFDEIKTKVNAVKSRIKRFLAPSVEVSAEYASEETLKRYTRAKTDYWQKVRGINEETVELFQLGFDPFSNAVTIPLRTLNGKLIGVTRRFISDDHLGARYKYPKGFRASQNLYASWLYEEYDVTTVSLHEGSIDTLKMWQLGIPAVAMYGATISEEHVNILLQMGVRKVVYFGDGDAAGIRAKERTHGYWQKPDGSYQYKKETDLTRHFTLFHVPDHGGKKDSGDMTDSEIFRAWRSAERYNPTIKIRRSQPKAPRQRSGVLYNGRR